MKKYKDKDKSYDEKFGKNKICTLFKRKFCANKIKSMTENRMNIKFMITNLKYL